MAFDQEVLKVVRAHGTPRVWHYTMCDALPSIIEHGFIYSRGELDRRGIPYASQHYYGTEEHERLLGEYVSGAPLPPWGMMRSEREKIALLELNPAVMALAGTCFCPGWSPRADFNPAEIVTWTGPERLEELYAGPGPMMITPCEFFVPDKVPTKAVRSIVFFDEASRDATRPNLQAAAAKRVTTDEHRIRIRVDPARFPGDWRESGPPWEEEQDAPKL